METYVPYLLDKLPGEGVGTRGGGAASRFTVEQVKDSVARDVEMLLNAHPLFEPDELEAQPLVARSLLTLGLADISSLSMASDGSNSGLMSSELSTYLAGRYVEFHILPLSFQESVSFYESRRKDFLSVTQHFDRYKRLGGFPVLHTTDYTYEGAYKIVQDIYSSTILRDTIQRFNIRDIGAAGESDKICSGKHRSNIFSP